MWLQADALAYVDASVSAFLTQAYCVILPLNPLFPALRSGPMAGSGAYPQNPLFPALRSGPMAGSGASAKTKFLL